MGEYWLQVWQSLQRDPAIILATLLSPLIAVLVTSYFQRIDRDYQFRLSVFTELMKHRRQRLSPQFVHALNLIAVVFHKNPSVRAALKDVLDVHSSNDWTIPNTEARFQEVQARLMQASETTVTILLGAMAKDLGINIDQLTVLQGAYLPVGWINAETIDTNIKQNLDLLLSGQKPLPVNAVVFNHPPQHPDSQSG